MLTKLLAMTKAELKSKIQSIDESAIKGRALRRQLAGMKKKEGGFTLLELLVVVAILAAIAGTATIMLQDTDRKGAAAAHVAMMDELSKGIQTYRVLQNGDYPNIWDSLLQSADGTLTAAAPLEILATGANLAASTLATAAEVAALANVGIDAVRVVSEGADGCAAGTIDDLIVDKSNNVVAQNIYKLALGTVAAGTRSGGCGVATNAALALNSPVMVWAGGHSRVNADATHKLVAFGAGPDSTLFDANRIGALSNVPVYRHVANNEYNRFVVLFDVTAPGAQATFHAIIDGAGDTKDEELGEVDNVRRT